jgi:hypothetical protein
MLGEVVTGVIGRKEIQMNRSGILIAVVHVYV